MNMTRKITVILLAVILMLLTACSSPATTSPSITEEGTTVPKNDGNNVLTFLGFLEPGGESPREQGAGELLKVFTEKTGYTLSCEIVGWEQVEQRLLMSVQANEAPDVSFVRSQSISIAVNSNALLSLESYISRDFTNEDKDDLLLYDQVGMYNGTKYTLPMSIIPYGIYARTDIFEVAGVTDYPETWDEFFDVAKQVNSSAASGFLFWGSAAQPAAIDYLQPMVEGFGGKLIDENEMGVFDSPEAMQAFHLIKRLVFDAGVVPQNVANLRYDETSDMFTAGRAAMYWDGSHRYSKYTGGVGAENLTLFKMPSDTAGTPSPSYIGFWSLGIPINSQNPDIAWEYIKNFVASDNQATYSKISGEVPVRKSAMEDPYFDENPKGQIVNWFVDYVSETGTVGVAPVDFNKLSEVLSMAVQEIITNENSDVEAIVTRACQDYNNSK